VTRVPVIVGVAQLLQREDDLALAKEPLELMVDAVHAAADDAGSRALLARADAVRVVRGMWRYQDPGRVVAQRIGSPSAKTALTQYGGNYVQTAVSRTFLDIQRGALDVAIVTGAECGRTWARLSKQGQGTRWSEAPGTPDEIIGSELTMWHDAEVERGIQMPIQVYPIFDVALRAALGESVDAHLKRISELWAGFSAVASRNPSAWIRERKTAEEIRTPGPDNRPVSFPYPMLMNSNSRVDMGAALVLTHEEMARKLGIPREKWVYPHAASDAHDHLYVSERDELHRSPAIRIAGRRALELAGVAPKDLAHRDLYSCFPSAVQVSARELGLDDSQPLTVTGGLTFGGGPMNNYVMHGIARMAEVLRDEPGAKGLVTGNGGYLTKHAFCIYSTEPPARPFVHEDLQAQVDALPKRGVARDHDGAVSIEAYSVMYGDDGAPKVGHAAVRLPDGRRAWGNVTDRDAAAAMTRDEFCGRVARLARDGVLTLG
jgi:acetyl-CoA C-acetyltransferase